MYWNTLSSTPPGHSGFVKSLSGCFKENLTLYDNEQTTRQHPHPVVLFHILMCSSAVVLQNKAVCIMSTNTNIYYYICWSFVYWPFPNVVWKIPNELRESKIVLFCDPFWNTPVSILFHWAKCRMSIAVRVVTGGARCGFFTVGEDQNVMTAAFRHSSSLFRGCWSVRSVCLVF